MLPLPPLFEFVQIMKNAHHEVLKRKCHAVILIDAMPSITYSDNCNSPNMRINAHLAIVTQGIL